MARVRPMCDLMSRLMEKAPATRERGGSKGWAFPSRYKRGQVGYAKREVPEPVRRVGRPDRLRINRGRRDLRHRLAACWQDGVKLSLRDRFLMARPQRGGTAAHSGCMSTIFRKRAPCCSSSRTSEQDGDEVQAIISTSDEKGKPVADCTGERRMPQRSRQRRRGTNGDRYRHRGARCTRSCRVGRVSKRFVKTAADGLRRA